MARKMIVEIVGDASSLERAFGRASKSAAGFSTTMTRSVSGIAKSFGLLAGTAGIFGLAAGLRSTIDASNDFESTMQKVVGLSGVAQSAIAGLTDEVLKMAPLVGRSPQELAEGLQFITSSGIDAAHAMDVLKVSAEASAAGLGETKIVADAVTSVMNAYGANVVSASSATDTLVATVREGKGEATDFAGVIGNVVSIASQLGVSFNDVGAALAAMTRLGTDAETASTQLQQIFATLVKTSPQSEKAFESVGLSAAGLRKELAEQGLLATLQTLEKAFKDNLPAAAKAFGNIRALRGVLALVGNQSKATAGIFDRLAGSSGSLNAAFGAVAETGAQKFAKLNAAVDATKITIGAALAPAAEKAADAIGKWLAKSENQERVQKDVEATVKTLGQALGDLRDTFNDLRGALEPVITKVGGLEQAIKLLLTAFAVSKIVNFSSAVTGIGTAAKGSAEQVRLLRLALLNLAAIGVVEVIIHRKEITEKFSGATDKIPDVVPGGTTSVDLSDMKLKGLEALKKKIAGFSGPLGAAVDAAIKKALEQGASSGISGASAVEEGRAGRPAATVKAITKAVADTTDTVVKGAKKAHAKSKKTVEDVAAEQRAAFQEMVDLIGVAIDKDLARKAFSKALADNQALQDAIRAQIKVEGHTAALERQLFQARQDRQQIRKDQRAAAGSAREADQFKALGLGPGGEDITPGLANLRRQFAQLGARIDPSQLSSKMRAAFKGIGRILSGSLGKDVGEPVRAKIRDLFKSIRDEWDKGSGDALTISPQTQRLNSNKVVEGLGLSRDVERELKSRLSGFNRAGRRLNPAPGTSGAFGITLSPTPVHINTTVNLDGQKVAQNTTIHQGKHKRSNPAQKRGPLRNI